MFKQDVISHFQARGVDSEAAIARAIGRTRQAVNNWGDIVPEDAAYRLHVLSGYQIPIRPEHYNSSVDAA